MKPVESLRELQLIELDILKFFADICEKNKLQYFLAFGTLLGAVRHQGFIPWDDDIDVAMPRSDYDKFIKIMDNEKGRYRLLRVKNDNDYSLVFAKVIDTNTVIYENVCDTIKKELSVYIDIFPLDALGNDAEKASRIISYENRKCGRIAHSAASNANLSTIRKCTHFVWKHYYSIKGRERCLEKEFDKLRANNFDFSKYIGLLSGFIFMNYVLDRKEFDLAVELNFEGHLFKAPIGYHEHLTQLYGDYMQLPPEEERVGKHNVEVYLKE